MNARIKSAEHEVFLCLNYGGIFHDGSHTTKDLSLEYKQSDYLSEIYHMRRFARALNELADALEEDSCPGKEKHEALAKIVADSCQAVGVSFEEAAPPIDIENQSIHLTFRYEEEALADRLIRHIRTRYASFGPEYWLSDEHPAREDFKVTEHICLRVCKSFIVSHNYWSVEFQATSGDYIMIENRQP